MLDEFKAETARPLLTQANHPENRPEPEPASAPVLKATLGRSIILSILGGVVGMIVGVAALSSTLVLGEPKSFLSVLPLVVTLVAFEAGYLGAMFFLCEEEGQKGHA